jgi:hypothetical protein
MSRRAWIVVATLATAQLILQVATLLEIRDYRYGYDLNTDFAIAARNAMRDQLDRIERRCAP